jgi:hypothetical protein
MGETRTLHWIHAGIRLCSNSALPVFCPYSNGASSVDAATSRFEEPLARKGFEIPHRKAFQGRRCPNNRWQNVDLVESCGLQFTAQPEAPAFALAGASGWAVNDEINCPLALCHALIL